MNNDKMRRGELPDRLQRRLRQPLPGAVAQGEFEAELSFGRHFGPRPAAARDAAVVLLLYPEEDGPGLNDTGPVEWKIPFTLRPAHLPHHAGQICLPGGMVEPGESSAEAALRELWEELGVPRDAVQLVGRLSPLYVWVSNFWVVPWVARVDAEPDWKPNPDEVDALVALSTEELLDPQRVGRLHHDRRGLRFSAPYIRAGEHKIWGATSMILGEFRAVLRELQDEPSMQRSA